MSPRTLLGVLDWGIGGLGFYALLKASHPNVPVLYWSDAGATPYGLLSRRALADRIAHVSDRMAALGVTHLVIACNAASTVANASRIAHTTGVIDHGVQAALATRASTIGVIGGARTVRAGHHRRQLQAADRVVIQRIAQPLSAAVERGRLDGPELRASVARILRPLRGVDALLMACTHYPALSPHFQRELPRATLVDPAAATLAWVEAHWPLEPAHSEDRFVTTGSTDAMQGAAQAAFGVRIPRATRP